MTTKIISNYYANNSYDLSSKYSGLRILSNAGFGSRVQAAFYATITNYGRVDASGIGGYGVYMQAGGVVQNGNAFYTNALIGGTSSGVETVGPSKVTNFGTIRGSIAGVVAIDGGAVTNGSANDRTAIISAGYLGVFLDSTSSALSNFGTITTGAGYAVHLAGGKVTNGAAGDTEALIEGDRAVFIGGAGVVVNFGALAGSTQQGVSEFSGSVTNGSATDATASISGYSQGVAITGASGTVANFGTVLGEGASGSESGVSLAFGGRVTNGGGGDVKALIEGYTAVVASGPATVANFGVIDGVGGARGDYGVLFVQGGALINGSTTDKKAFIDGYTGVSVLTGAGTINNFGTVIGEGASRYGFGVYLKAGGTVTNGAVTDANALVEGDFGLELEALGTVDNFGTILGDGASVGDTAAYLAHGGAFTNGAAGDRSALVQGYQGVVIGGAAGFIDNFGTIDGASSQSGVGAALNAGGYLLNGSLNNSSALIEGYIGVDLVGSASATNLGTISATQETGVLLAGGQSLVNGAAGHAGAVIEGYTGVQVNGSGTTVTNFGTVSGSNFALFCFTGGDTVVVEAGCVFHGAVGGGGGTLDLDSGIGTLTGLFSSEGDVTVSGSMATTTFLDFGTLEVGANAQFVSSGAVTLAVGQTVNDAGILNLGASKAAITSAGLIETTGAGNLTLAGALKNTGTLAANGGTLTVIAAVTGAGAATINGGTLDFTSGFNEAVTFAGTAGVLELAQSQTYTAGITGFSKTGGTSLDLVDIGFVSSSEATYSGTKTGGVLTVTDGTHTAHINLKGNYLTSTWIASSDGHGGTIVVDPAKAAASPPHLFIAAMAGLGAGGGGLEPAGAREFRVPPTLLAPRAAVA